MRAKDAALRQLEAPLVASITSEIVGALRRQPPHRAARQQNVIAVAIGHVPEVAEQIAVALMDEQQLVAVGIAHQMRHRLRQLPDARTGSELFDSSSADLNGSFCASAAFFGIERARRQRAFEIAPARRRIAVIDMRRGAEEPVAPDLALVRAFRQIGMRLARGLALDAREFDPVLATHARPVSRSLRTPRRIWSSFDAFEQRLEIAFAEALIALALDDLEEDRADGVLGEDLQQQACPRPSRRPSGCGRA